MVIVKLFGNLGEQMFQYAYAKALQQKGYEVCIHISNFKSKSFDAEIQLNQFKIDLKTPSNISILLSKIRFIQSIKERNLLFDKNLFKISKSACVRGFFQTEAYFKDIRVLILKQFTVKKELSNSTVNYLKEITIKNNSCSIHIQKSDFENFKKEDELLKIGDVSYYKQAMGIIAGKFNKHHFFIFSDDISWAKKKLKLKNVTYINHDVIPHENLHLMSLCNHNITSNNSFSWWGAWLNQHKNKIVIAPKNWCTHKKNEIICSDWIKI